MKGGVDEEDIDMWLCILSVFVPVCSQPAQAVTGKETFDGVKTAGTCVNDGRINKKDFRIERKMWTDLLFTLATE